MPEKEKEKSAVCWQKAVRDRNLEEDLKICPVSDYTKLKVSDFTFKVVTDKAEQVELKKFIERHEWLGNTSQYPTHWFAMYLGDVLSGVLIMNVPNAFSKMLGDGTDKLERLISRGACISWSPKNLASHLITQSIKWVVKNTEYRLFSAYSDPEANELGTVYQACNFMYVGQNSGTTKRYINPYTGKIVSDRFFRQKTAYKKFAKELGIEWQKNWNHATGMNWHNMPSEVEAALRAFSKEKQSASTLIEHPSKHKYVYVLGRNKVESSRLKKLFLSRNKIKPYPTIRGK